ARDGNPDLILMDIQLLGNIDGIEAAQLIHAEQPTPIIFATAYGDDAYISKALGMADPYGFLHKPVDDKAALTMIKIALARFSKDQLIIRINHLLQLKDELFSKLIDSQSVSEIGEHVIETLAAASMFEESWIITWSESVDLTFNACHGISKAVFNDYVERVESKDLIAQKAISRDELMSTILGKPTYSLPLRLAGKTISTIGFAPASDDDLDQKEFAILTDISQVIAQSIQNSRLQKEQQQAQRQIVESESRLKAIVKNSTTGIYLINDTYEFEYVNDRLCEIFGREREEIIGSKFPDYLGASREMVKKYYEDRQAGDNVPGEYELDIVRPDGEVRDMIISASVFTDAQGNVKNAGHLLDITNQKVANLELTKLSKAIEQSPAMKVITDLAGNIEFVNAEFTRITGYSAEEAMGKSTSILKSGFHDQDFYKDLWDTITSGATWTGELINKTKAGIINWERASITPIRDAASNITHYVAVKEDITQTKKEQEEALKNQKLKDILYGIISAAIEVKDVSTLYEKIYQFISEIISTSNFFMAILNKADNRIYFPFDRDYFDTDMPESIACDPQASLTARTIVSGKTLHVKSEQIRKLMGEGQITLAGDVPSVWLGIPLKVEGEVIGAFVLQEYDGIAQYKHEDVRLLDLAAGQVALTIDRVRKEAALRELADELSHANGMKELLLDVITHDLRNPAGVISSITEMLEADDSDNELLEILRGSSDSLMKVIENATVLSKLSIGESIAREDLDLVILLKDVAAEFGSQLSTASMTINLDLPETLIVNINPILSEIPKNYISNAIKYSSAGKIIDLILKEEGDRVVLRVNDRGVPIPEDKRSAIFHRSIQLAKGEKKGRGLGLAIVKRIA
ncbi:MAG: PAS domain S-box protein, partial [Candidatus Marinimicrobia bacterium]|nr:PAS domain S-box protein [Candidatus Neomarinimicrobiota bacterium]